MSRVPEHRLSHRALNAAESQDLENDRVDIELGVELHAGEDLATRARELGLEPRKPSTPFLRPDEVTEIRRIAGFDFAPQLISALESVCRHFSGDDGPRCEEPIVRKFVDAAESLVSAWDQVEPERRAYLSNITQDSGLATELERIVPSLKQLVQNQRRWRTRQAGRPVAARRHRLLVALACACDSHGVPLRNYGRGKFASIARVISNVLGEHLPSNPTRVIAAAIDEYRQLSVAVPQRDGEPIDAVNVFENVGAVMVRRHTAK